MTIYLLDNDPALCARYLDDKSLDKPIKAIAQILYTTHKQKFGWIQIQLNPYQINKNEQKWAEWASNCVANYMYLVKLGLACCEEYRYRNNSPQTMWEENNKFVYRDGATLQTSQLEPVIEWTKWHVPSLPIEVKKYSDILQRECYIPMPTPFPLCIPDKYIGYLSSTVREGQEKPVDIVQSYRNYYQAKIKDQLKPKKCKGCQKCEFKFNHYIGILPTWLRRTKPEWLEI